MKKIGILGSTGSVGSQTLEIIDEYKAEFELVFMISSNLQFLKPLPGDKKDIASSKFVFPVPFFATNAIF